MIRGIPHHTLEHIHNGLVGRLTQGRKQSLGFAHATMLPERRQREHPLTRHVRVVRSLAGCLIVYLKPEPPGAESQIIMGKDIANKWPG
ncbi:hypothetical protein IVB30_21800 [Bradyrhizobium sp. 200]|uniref:hypothetical protein n=1 Tax=Bradyrhizobium sp. 200 TaxID=2782665 RepID=UPI001FFEC0C9|nr:hypothetical protein [Bradyrhizobium sp. 200]UPJ54693.1 hypothetical protein IVB30_21800 [Bradyrhizobium sp. 200]